MEQARKSHLILDSFWIKIIAMITMTFDHVGAVMTASGFKENWFVILITIFRYIGRLALPLYCFMIAEGMKHTKKPGMYFLRLGVMAVIISIALYVIVSPLGMASLRLQGNIFIDLLLGAVMIYCLTNKRWYIKIIALLPLAFSILSFIVKGYENGGNGFVYFLPFFLRMQYDWYSILMIVLFYFAYSLSRIFIEQHAKQVGLEPDVFVGTNFERNTINVISLGVIVFMTLIFFGSSFIIPDDFIYWTPDIQNFAMVAGAFLLLYNGRRGYNAKWFQYGSYLYYPLHILVIYGIAMLINLFA